ncbi:tyrosine-protein phosphatase [Dyadobacter sp.]|uniref:tyrosine-protein phosphatase n=1 Tax=Dyadobacter sp. TaxID=1914288 RepID=UPI003F6EC18E
MLSWLFDRKSQNTLDFAHICIDIHSHVLPGIDDGVQTIEESLAMLRRMQTLGFKKIVTTPHVMWDCYRNTPEIILDRLEEVRSAANIAGIDLQVDAAAEYFIDEHFIELLRTEQPLLTLPGNRLLVELPYTTPLLNTSENLFSIIQYGYQPVLAHPERYTYFFSDLSIYKKLVDQGCELQLNALSSSGHYGENISKTAEWLLKNNLITFIGTDAHRTQHLDQISKNNKNRKMLEYPFQNEKLLSI